MMDERKVKVKTIFDRFDANGDGGLDREEMAALILAVNPTVKFTHQQMLAIVNEIVRSYDAYIDEDKGLSLAGLMRTYDDGAGDVNRDFEVLGLVTHLSAASTSSMATAPTIPGGPSHEVILDGCTWSARGRLLVWSLLHPRISIRGYQRLKNVRDSPTEPLSDGHKAPVGGGARRDQEWWLRLEEYWPEQMIKLEVQIKMWLVQ